MCSAVGCIITARNVRGTASLRILSDECHGALCAETFLSSLNCEAEIVLMKQSVEAINKTLLMDQINI